VGGKVLEEQVQSVLYRTPNTGWEKREEDLVPGQEEKKRSRIGALPDGALNVLLPRTRKRYVNTRT